MKTYPLKIDVWESDIINQTDSYLAMNFYQNEIDNLFRKDEDLINCEIEKMYENKQYRDVTESYHIEEWKEEREHFIHNETFNFVFDENNEVQKVEVTEDEYNQLEQQFEAENPMYCLLEFDISKFYKKRLLIKWSIYNNWLSIKQKFEFFKFKFLYQYNRLFH